MRLGSLILTHECQTQENLTDNSPILDVTLSGGVSLEMTTDAIGDYLLDGLASCIYTITPSKSYQSFSLASKTITVSPDALRSG